METRSVSDRVGTTIDATPGVASDPPAHAEGLYGGMDGDKNGTFAETAERLPDKYHPKSQLTATVSPGSNDTDFKLAAQPTANPQ